MTVEELKEYCKKQIEMCEMILEQESCEDCISRQAVLDMLENTQIITDGEFCGYCTEDIDINILPSVTSQPKTGRWILAQRDNYIDINCSECGNTRIKGYGYGYTVDELNLEDVNGFIARNRIKYCECCGAKMEEVS